MHNAVYTIELVLRSLDNILLFGLELTRCKKHVIWLFLAYGCCSTSDLAADLARENA